MKRLWLTWDGDKATGVWEGRIGDVELEEGFTSAFLRGVNLRAGDEIIRLITSDEDRDHGNHPVWIDGFRSVGLDDPEEPMTLTQRINRLMEDPDVNEAAEQAGMTREELSNVVVDVLAPGLRNLAGGLALHADTMPRTIRERVETLIQAELDAPDSGAQHTLAWYPEREPQRIVVDVEVR